MNINISRRRMQIYFCISISVIFCYFLIINNAIANEKASRLLSPIYYLLMGDSAESGELIEHRYIKNTGPDKNPMKGWISAWDLAEVREETSVGF